MSKISEITKKKLDFINFPRMGTWLNEEIENEVVQKETSRCGG